MVNADQLISGRSTESEGPWWYLADQSGFMQLRKKLRAACAPTREMRDRCDAPTGGVQKHADDDAETARRAAEAAADVGCAAGALEAWIAEHLGARVLRTMAAVQQEFKVRARACACCPSWRSAQHAMDCKRP